MNIVRQEIRTGLLVILSMAALLGLLLYIGAPSVLVKQQTYRIYLDNAGGLKLGTEVLLGGRRIGQVEAIQSPVPEVERPAERYEAMIEVKVGASSRIYRDTKVKMVQIGILADPVIDFVGGREVSGLAMEGTYFTGERVPGLSDAVPILIEQLDPVLKQLRGTLATLEQTSSNLRRMTAAEGELPQVLEQWRLFGENLNELSGEGSALRLSFQHLQSLTGEGGSLEQTLEQLEKLTGPTGSLSKTLENAEKFTADLAQSRDLQLSLGNFRRASEGLGRTVGTLAPQLDAIGKNLEQATDTVKRQPWRLIWPSTKKYPEDRLPESPKRVTKRTK